MTKITVSYRYMRYCQYIYIHLICNLKLSHLNSYYITDWIMKKFILWKIIKNQDLYFLNTSLEYFVLILFLVVPITIYVSTCFPSALDKGNLHNFLLPPLFCGIDEKWNWGEPCDLKCLRERAYRGRWRFSSGWRHPQGQHFNKTGKFLYLQEKQLHKAKQRK